VIVCKFIKEVVDTCIFDGVRYFLGEEGIIVYKYIKEEYY
jgi:hypothetical protein